MAGPLLPVVLPPLISSIGGFFSGLFGGSDSPEPQQRQTFTGQSSAQSQLDFAREATRAALIDAIIAQNQPQQFGGAPDPTALLAQLGMGESGIGLAPGVAEFGRPIDFLPPETGTPSQLAFASQAVNRGLVPRNAPSAMERFGQRRDRGDFDEDMPGGRFRQFAEQSLGEAAAAPNGPPPAAPEQTQLSQQIDNLIQDIINQGRLA